MIAGIFQRDGAPLDRALLRTIATAPAYHRGERVNVWANQPVGLANVGSLQAEQLFADVASGCVITFEGRIDNRAELSHALKNYHALLHRKSDAVLVLASYLNWGTACVRHLLGDFAFAIWDARDQKLFLARDPLGQRPLYYAPTPARFVFSSTLEQLIQPGALLRELDDEILLHYLYAYGALRESTPYRGIHSLPGGNYLCVDARDLKTENYFAWQTEPPAPRAFTENDVEEFRALFAECVRCRVDDDARTGLLFSGGLDSGSIASMAGHLRVPIHTYSFVFEKFSECDERAYIAPIVERYRMPHTAVLCDDAWTLATLDPWRSVFSEPYFTPYDALYYRALERARADGMRVMLMGHGGDLLLDGSPRYFADWLVAGRWRELHHQLRDYSAATRRPYIVAFAGNALSPLFPSWARRAIEFRHLPRIKNLIPKHLRSHGFDALPDLHRGKQAWWYDLRDAFNYGQTPQEAHLDRLMRLFGLEIRQPFVDVRLIQFVLSLPPNATYADGTHRVILRKGLRDILPRQVYSRRNKASFAPLFEYGMQERQKFVRALLHHSELGRRGLVVESEWQRLVEENLGNIKLTFNTFWQTLVLEIWLRIQTGRLPELN